jgi:hypothetical protein
MYKNKLVGSFANKNKNELSIQFRFLSLKPRKTSDNGIVLGAHKLRARRTVCKSVFFKDINC